MQQASITSFFSGGKPSPCRALEMPAEDSNGKRQRIAEVATPTRCDAAIVLDETPEKDTQDHNSELTGMEKLSMKLLPNLPHGMTDWLPFMDAPGALPAKWATALDVHLRKPSFTALRSFLCQEDLRGAYIYPPKQEVFSAFHACDIDAVRVVIIGQDPYHDVGQANGLAFSVKPGIPLPPSLKNMLKEVSSMSSMPAIPSHGCLMHWARQGVLLLNTCLTVRAHAANSHQKRGWEEFTDAVVHVLNQRLSGVVFLLWGLPAQKKGACVSKDKHVVIKTSHPSPFSADRPSAGNPAFLGSQCFSRCNDELCRLRRGPPIDWSIGL